MSDQDERSAALQAQYGSQSTPSLGERQVVALERIAVSLGNLNTKLAGIETKLGFISTKR